MSDKLTEALTITFPVIDRHLDIISDYIGDLAYVEDFTGEFNKKLNRIIQKAEGLVTMLEKFNHITYPQKVISGGQTGVDRAALDAAIEALLPIGGYVPKGRLAEDGQVPEKYPMTEIRAKDYKVRTKQNVMESDGTLIINIGPLKSGTAFTAKKAQQSGKPLMVVQLEQNCQAVDVIKWLYKKQIQTLNIAGPRESKVPGIYEKAKAFLEKVLM